jgi:predicted membrane-bound mannosyltransferase
VAGEKMPWLLTHMALPMCVLGGWWLGNMVRHIDWRAARGGAGLAARLCRARAGNSAGGCLVPRLPANAETTRRGASCRGC